MWLKGWAAVFSCLPAGQDLLLGSVYPRVCACAPARTGMCARCTQTCVCVARGCAGMCACVWVSVQMVGTGIWLSSPSSTQLRHRGGCALGRGWCGENCHGATDHSAVPGGIWPCCPQWGLRTDLGVKKLGENKLQGVQPGYLLHQCNLIFLKIYRKKCSDNSCPWEFGKAWGALCMTGTHTPICRRVYLRTDVGCPWQGPHSPFCTFHCFPRKLLRERNPGHSRTHCKKPEGLWTDLSAHFLKLSSLLHHVNPSFH